MLLGMKRFHKKENNWSVVLNPINSEIDKRKVARKITDLFGLSIEDSSDLVNNTPIILLDDLSQTSASKVKTLFNSTGADMFLTNETHVKRKCYRTVWPEPPQLGFLKEDFEEQDIPEEGELEDDVVAETEIEEAASASTEISAKEESERLPAEDALDEMRSLSKEVERIKAEQINKEIVPEPKKQEVPQEMAQEMQRLRAEVDQWQQKFNEQRQSAEKLSWELSLREKADQPSNQDVHEKEQELENHKQLLADAHEKYAVLQDEYQKARELFDEKIGESQREAEAWKEQLDTLQKEYNEKAESHSSQSDEEKAQYEKEMGELRELFASSERKYQALEAEFKQSRELWNEKEAMASQELELWKNKAEGVESQVQEIRAQKDMAIQESQELRGNLNDLEDRYRVAEDELKRLKLETEESLVKAQAEMTEWKSKIENFDVEVRGLREQRDAAIREMQESQELLKDAGQRHLAMEEEVKQVRAEVDKKVQQVQTEVQDWKNKVEFTENQLRAVRHDKDTLAAKSAAQDEMIQGWQAKCETLHNDLEGARALHQQDLNRLSENEKRCEELEESRTSLMQMLQAEQQKLQTLETDYQALKKVSEDEKTGYEVKVAEWESQIRAGEEKVREFEGVQSRLTHDLQSRADEVKSWEEKFKVFEEKMAETKEAYEKLDKMHQVSTQLLESREKELGSTRRQLHDLKMHREQQNFLQKSTQISEVLGEKEARLSYLVEEQQRIESEIRSRESVIGKILTDQEKVEKEILEAKQAKRHYMELMKKDKPSVLKVSKPEQGATIQAPSDVPEGPSTVSDS